MNTDSAIPFISVVLCTYNPRPDFLQRVLDGVRRQTLPKDRWEFIVVDNNSPVPLVARSGQETEVGKQETEERRQMAIDLSSLPDARIVVEKEQGLSQARRRGFQEARGEIIVNLDDDAVLDDDYLEKVCKIAKKFPFIGVFGGQRRGEFEKPPQWPISEYYGAERLVDEDIWSNDREHVRSMPVGVGSVVRRVVADSYVEKLQKDTRWKVLGRTADKLLSCEDLEIAMIASDVGLGRGIFKSLSLTHLIPEKRMTLDFLCRNAEGNGYSSTIHNYLRFGQMPMGRSLMGRLNRLYRLLSMPSRKRQQEIAKDRGIREGIALIRKMQREKKKD